jgi:methylmalonyl-CoA mutase, C-terminal domain
MQEDAGVVWLSILSGAQNQICPRVMELLQEQGLTDVLVLVVGIIPDVDVPRLQRRSRTSGAPFRARSAPR